MSSLPREIDIAVNVSEAAIEPAFFERVVREVLENAALIAIPAGDLSLVFVSDEEIAKLHGEFMEDPTPTDVITFNSDAEMGFAGEVVISVDTARTNAAKFQTDVRQELTLYLVHGLLHLSGLNDHEEAQREEMRRGEKRVMNHLGQQRFFEV